MSDTPHVATHADVFAAILEVTGWVLPAMSPGRVGRLAKDLLEAGVTGDEIRYYFGTTDPGAGWWYYREDWRGKRGQRPNELALRENAGKWRQPIAVTMPSKYASIEAWAQRIDGHD